MKTSRILFVSMIAFMLMLPLASMITATPSVDLNAPIESRSAPANDFQRIGTIEGIVTQIDPEGGVRNAIATFQNASYYGITYTAPYQAVVESQMATDTGYVSMCQLEVAGRTVYPNGRIGDAAAMLTLIINPIIVLPENASNVYLTEPTLQDALNLADELVTLYETDFSIEFNRLATIKSSTYINFYYDENSTINTAADSYYIQFVSIPDDNGGDIAMGAMRTRLSGLGGFMDLLEATEWPMERTDFAETLLFDHSSEASSMSGPMLNPMYMYMSVTKPYVRADETHTSYVETVNTGVIALAGFDTPEYVSDGAGTETYSLKQHVGYVGDIESKMFQDMTINSISSIVAVVPTELTISGVSPDWEYLGKDFRTNVTGDMALPTGGTISANATVAEIIQALMVSAPYSLAVMLNQSTFTMEPNMFDTIIDSLWASAGPFPDLREYFLEMDWSMAFPGVPVEEVNQDALRMIMEEIGITPGILLDQVNETLIEENPMQALVEAVIKCFDNYHLLDILQNTTYSNPYILEEYLNEYITNIETFIADFTGVDLPSSYATKEAFAALIEDHFGLVLQGLWDAMAAFVGDTTNIKTAVQAMIDPEHLAKETVPYLVADTYASVVTEYDYGMYINFDLLEALNYLAEDIPLLWLTTEDIVLTFDLDISSIEFEGPHCIIRKTVPHEMTLGSNYTVTIIVENIGDATAYDLKILDGISAGFDSDKQYYWNRATLAADENWTVTCTYTPEVPGTYVEIPAILCYFNTTLVSFEPGDMENWDGAAMYTISAVVEDQIITADDTTTDTSTSDTSTSDTTATDTTTTDDFWGGDILGIPTIIIVITGSIGIVVIVVVIIVKKRP